MKMIEGSSVIASSSVTTHRCFVIVGSVHGNEPAGARAIAATLQMIDRGEWKVDGAVYGLIGNPKAVLAGTRFTQENLNRAFGRATNPDSYEAKRSEEITAWFKELAQEYSEMYLLDLHSVSVGETRMAIYNIENPRAKAWAHEISPIPFSLAEKDDILPGALTNAFESVGGTAVAIECGNHESSEGEIVALEHVENALTSLQMMKDPTVTFRNKVAYEGSPRTYELMIPIKPHTGFVWDVPVASEMPLKAGQVFAHDDFGQHVAPEDCYMLMPTKIPEPDDFDAGFLAARTA